MWRCFYSEKSFVMIKAKKKYPDNASKEAMENETEEVGESKVDDAGTPDILNHWWPLAFESELDSDKPSRLNSLESLLCFFARQMVTSIVCKIDAHINRAH